MKHHSPYYQVGLGSKFLARTRIVFVGLLIGCILLSGSAVYAETKTGELNQKVIQPVKFWLANLSQSLTQLAEEAEQKDFLSNTSTIVSTNSSQINIQINTSVKTTPKANTIYQSDSINTQKAPSSPTSEKTYEQSVQEMNEWANQTKEANDKWFEQQKAENQKAFETQSSQNAQNAQDWFNQKVEEGRKWLESQNQTPEKTLF